MDFIVKFMVFIMHIYVTFSQENDLQAVEYYCGNKPADVVFLLDSSNSIYYYDFLKQIDFVKSITDLFTIGKNITRVGVVSYSHDIKVNIDLDDYSDKDSLMAAIGKIQQYYGYTTNTQKAIHYARKHMFGYHNKRDKDKVARIIVVISDGQSKNMLKTVWEAIKAKNEGVRMISVGVGSKINVRELKMIASRPVEEHMFIVYNFDTLKTIKQVLAVQTCKVTPKTTTTTTTSTTTTTTTTSTTTTTEPTTTTESLYAAAQRICYADGLTDVVFALDSSNNVRPHEFRKQIEFAQRITKNFVIGQNRSRVGAILYSDQVQRLIDLPEFETQDQIVEALDKVEQSGGGTRMDEAIRYIRTKSFRRSVARRHAAMVAVIITASPTSSLHLTKKQAHEARKAGITLIPIGIGDVNIDEMRAIAGTSDDSYQHVLPSFDDLDFVLPKVAINTCEVTEPAITVSDMSCGSRQEADLMFILDSINAGKKNTRKALAFIQDLVNDLDVDKNKIQVGLMAGDECKSNSKTSTGFNLGAIKNKEETMSALTDKQEVDFASILKSMRRGAFSVRKGGRRHARKIAILIIDGTLDDPDIALKEAKRARIHGIEVYVVQVGDDKPQEELMMMSDSPFGDARNFFKVKDYNELKQLKKLLWDSLCDEL